MNVNSPIANEAMLTAIHELLGILPATPANQIEVAKQVLEGNEAHLQETSPALLPASLVMAALRAVLSAVTIDSIPDTVPED